MAVRVEVTKGHLESGEAEKILIARAYCLLGMVNDSLSNRDASLQNYKSALSFNPKEAKALAGIGTYSYNLKDYGTALQLANEAIRLNPDEVDGFALCGMTQYAQDAFQEAIYNYERAAALDLQESEYYLYLGHSYFSRKKYKEAIPYYSKTIELDPGSSSGFTYRGYSNYYLKKFASAVADFETAEKLDPTSSKKFRTSFSEIKPVNGFLLVGFLIAIILVCCLPLLLDKRQVLNRLFLLQIGGWFVLEAVFFLGNLRPKDIGLDFKKILSGLSVSLVASLLIALLAQVFKPLNNPWNFFLLPGADYTTGKNNLWLVVIYLLPVAILQEFLFRGFFFPQIFLKLRGPYRVFTSMTVATTLAILMQFEILFITLDYLDALGNIFFSLTLVSYTVMFLYYRTGDIFGSIGITFLLYPFLAVFRVNINSMLFFQAFQFGIYYFMRLKSNSETKLLVINDRVDHNDTSIMRFFDKYDGLNWMLIIWAIYIYFGKSLIDRALNFELSSVLFFISFFSMSAAGLAFEVYYRLRSKPAPKVEKAFSGR